MLNQRFWDKVDKKDTCWEWNASLIMGYGQFWNSQIKKRVLAHRFSYELHKGKIPDGLQIDHLCRNPACVNPDHLEPVTQKENLLRGNRNNGQPRRSIYCIRGHILDARNRCKECNKIRSQNLRDKRKISSIDKRKIRKTHCKKGHEFSEKNTHIDIKGYWHCRTCSREFKRNKKQLQPHQFREYRIK